MINLFSKPKAQDAVKERARELAKQKNAFKAEVSRRYLNIYRCIVETGAYITTIPNGLNYYEATVEAINQLEAGGFMVVRETNTASITYKVTL